MSLPPNLNKTLPPINFSRKQNDKAKLNMVGHAIMPNKKLINLKQLLSNSNYSPKMPRSGDRSCGRPSQLNNLTKTEVNGKFDLMVIERSVKVINEVKL